MISSWLLQSLQAIIEFGPCCHFLQHRNRQDGQKCHFINFNSWLLEQAIFSLFEFQIISRVFLKTIFVFWQHRVEELFVSTYVTWMIDKIGMLRMHFIQLKRTHKVFYVKLRLTSALFLSLLLAFLLIAFAKSWSMEAMIKGNYDNDQDLWLQPIHLSRLYEVTILWLKSDHVLRRGPSVFSEAPNVSNILATLTSRDSSWFFQDPANSELRALGISASCWIDSSWLPLTRLLKSSNPSLKPPRAPSSRAEKNQSEGEVHATWRDGTGRGIINFNTTLYYDVNKNCCYLIVVPRIYQTLAYKRAPQNRWNLGSISTQDEAWHFLWPIWKKPFASSDAIWPFGHSTFELAEGILTPRATHLRRGRSRNDRGYLWAVPKWWAPRQKPTSSRLECTAQCRKLKFVFSNLIEKIMQPDQTNPDVIEHRIIDRFTLNLSFWGLFERLPHHHRLGPLHEHALTHVSACWHSWVRNFHAFLRPWWWRLQPESNEQLWLPHLRPCPLRGRTSLCRPRETVKNSSLLYFRECGCSKHSTEGIWSSAVDGKLCCHRVFERVLDGKTLEAALAHLGSTEEMDSRGLDERLSNILPKKEYGHLDKEVIWLKCQYHLRRRL